MKRKSELDSNKEYHNLSKMLKGNKCAMQQGDSDTYHGPLIGTRSNKELVYVDNILLIHRKMNSEETIST